MRTPFATKVIYFYKTGVENAPTDVLFSDFNKRIPHSNRPNGMTENQIFATGKINRHFNFLFCPFGRMNRRKNLSNRRFDFVFASAGFPDGGIGGLDRCFGKIMRLFAVSFSGLERLFASSLQDNHKGVEQDFDIGGKGYVFHVKQVVFQSFHHLFHRVGIAEFDLSPRGYAGLYP